MLGYGFGQISSGVCRSFWLTILGFDCFVGFDLLLLGVLVAGFWFWFRNYGLVFSVLCLCFILSCLGCDSSHLWVCDVCFWLRY